MAEATTLVKYLAAHSGFSRRNATDLIKEGKVAVNSSVIVKPWQEIAAGDDIRVDGKRVKVGGKVYFLLNKPVDYITTMEDDLGRQDVSLLMKGATRERIFPIGRLDKDTTGLLIFTNDGDLAQTISHPRFKMKKEYQVTLDKPVNPEHLKLMFKGVFLPDGKARVDRAALMPGKRKYVVIVEIHSGKKHIIRRLFQHFGYEVRELDRIEYAGLGKKGLPLGKWRALTPDEVESLQKMAAAAAASAPKPRVGKPASRDGRYSSDRKRTDFHSKPSSSGNRFGERPAPKFRDGKRIERPDLRRKKELIIGTEEWFAQDDVKPVAHTRSREDRHERFSDRSRSRFTRDGDDARPRTRPERENSKASFRKSDFGAPQADYTPRRRSSGPNADRVERSNWTEKRESRFDVESWFNGGDDARPQRRTGSREDFRPARRFDADRAPRRDDRAERPSWRDKREFNAERTDFREDSRPQRRFDADRAPRRADRAEHPSWRDTREFNAERTDFREDFRPQRRFDADRGPRRDDRAERPSWGDARDGEMAKPRTRSKPAFARKTSNSSSAKPARMVRTKPAHVRTKPGGGGKKRRY